MLKQVSMALIAAVLAGGLGVAPTNEIKELG
jgi:hypothetical protein